MAEPNPDKWAQSHMRWLALSRWDNEGGASPLRPTAGSTDPNLRHDFYPAPGSVPLLLALSETVPSAGAGYRPIDPPARATSA